MPAARTAAVLGRAALLACVLTGCQTPFTDSHDEIRLETAMVKIVDREITGIGPPDGVTLTTTQPPAAVEEALEIRLEELEAIGPATDTARTPFDLGRNLIGSEQLSVALSLDSAIKSAVSNNLVIRRARLDPAINEADVIQAEAEFDAILFSSVDFAKVDQPSTLPIVAGVPVGTPFNASETYRFETGVRKRFHTGGEVTLSTELTRFRNNARGLELEPDPAYTAAIRLGVVQPLLRGFGKDVNTAIIRIAANSEERATAELTGDMLDIVARTELAYWDLALRWQEIEIRQWLVNVGEEVRDKLERRRDHDTTVAEWADAVARVERRKAGVIRSRQELRRSSDILKELMNDLDLSVGTESVLKPIDAFIDTPVEYNLRSAILTAVDQRPEVEIARLDISDSAIRKLVADNSRLPLLNVSGEVAYFGLDDQAGDAYEDTLDNDFIDYILGLFFEYPLGNRAAEAEFRRARLRQSQALIGYRQTVQAIVLDVKAALRSVVTNFELISATRSSRIASAENMRALQVEEDTMAGLTPEFLNLKFERQDSLALARQEEFLALVNFDQSLAALYRAMGTGLQMRNIAVERDNLPGMSDFDGVEDAERR